MTPQATRDSKGCQLFLHAILRHSGSGLVVLYAASLGEQRVVHFAEDDKIGLVSYIKDNKANLHCPALGSGRWISALGPTGDCVGASVYEFVVRIVGTTDSRSALAVWPACRSLDSLSTHRFRRKKGWTEGVRPLGLWPKRAGLVGQERCSRQIEHRGI